MNLLPYIPPIYKQSFKSPKNTKIQNPNAEDDDEDCEQDEEK